MGIPVLLSITWILIMGIVLAVRISELNSDIAALSKAIVQLNFSSGMQREKMNNSIEKTMMTGEILEIISKVWSLFSYLLLDTIVNGLLSQQEQQTEIDSYKNETMVDFNKTYTEISSLRAELDSHKNETKVVTDKSHADVSSMKTVITEMKSEINTKVWSSLALNKIYKINVLYIITHRHNKQNLTLSKMRLRLPLTISMTRPAQSRRI